MFKISNGTLNSVIIRDVKNCDDCQGFKRGVTTKQDASENAPWSHVRLSAYFSHILRNKKFILHNWLPWKTRRIMRNTGKLSWLPIKDVTVTSSQAARQHKTDMLLPPSGMSNFMFVVVTQFFTNAVTHRS